MPTPAMFHPSGHTWPIRHVTASVPQTQEWHGVAAHRPSAAAATSSAPSTDITRAASRLAP